RITAKRGEERYYGDCERYFDGPAHMTLSEPADTVLRTRRCFSTLALAGVHLEHAEFDAGYVSRLKSGDSETQKHFTAYFSNVIWLKLRGRVRAHHLIEEIRQETFARVLKYLESGKTIEYPERFGGFVLAVCNNVMLEVLRLESQQPHTS